MAEAKISCSTMMSQTKRPLYVGELITRITCVACHGRLASKENAVIITLYKETAYRGKLASRSSSPACRMLPLSLTQCGH